MFSYHHYIGPVNRPIKKDAGDPLLPAFLLITLHWVSSVMIPASITAAVAISAVGLSELVAEKIKHLQ